MAAELQPKWGHPPEVLTLSRNEVHVWKVPLNRAHSELRLSEQTLAPDERSKAERFHFERDRARFIAARGQLRMILGRYAGIDASVLEFSYGPRGKPSLVQRSEAGALKFNLSHSGELALVGVAQDRDIGIDIEAINHLDAEGIADHFFSAREKAALQALPVADRLEAFFDYWTCKEAYVKAIGDGLSRPTESFDVGFASHRTAYLANVDGQPEEASRWSLKMLTPASGYVAAIAVEGHDWTLTCWELSKQISVLPERAAPYTFLTGE